MCVHSYSLTYRHIYVLWLFVWWGKWWWGRGRNPIGMEDARVEVLGRALFLGGATFTQLCSYMVTDIFLCFLILTVAPGSRLGALRPTPEWWLSKGRELMFPMGDSNGQTQQKQQIWPPAKPPKTCSKSPLLESVRQLTMNALWHFDDKAQKRSSF